MALWTISFLLVWKEMCLQKNTDHQYDLKYYKGYIRNLKKLCTELDIATVGPTKEIERRVILKGYTRWKDEIVNHL
ncbi:MAG: hypothetical protein ACI4EY_04505, partial [Lachnospiraceae bacterium]